MTGPTLEERVAALEELIAHPLMTIEAPAWTDEQVAQFKAEFERYPGSHEVRLLPPAPVLAPETAKALLRECVTVVSPGEALAIRVPEGWTPQQVKHYQEYASAVAPFPVLVVIGEELAVAKGFDQHAAEALSVAAADPFAGKAAQRGG